MHRTKTELLVACSIAIPPTILHKGIESIIPAITQTAGSTRSNVKFILFFFVTIHQKNILSTKKTPQR